MPNALSEVRLKVTVHCREAVVSDFVSLPTFSWAQDHVLERPMGKILEIARAEFFTGHMPCLTPSPTCQNTDSF